MDKKKPGIEALKAKAESGDVQAQLWLGMYYYLGVGVETDLAEALKMYMMAADQGDMKGQFESASIIEKYNAGSVGELRKALDLYHDSANQDYVNAQYRLGAIYEEGLWAYHSAFSEPYCVAGIDLQAAYRWYKKAADQGHHMAMYRLGLLLRDGKGITKNGKKAFQYLLRAACGDIAPAQTEVSHLYHSGIGVDKDCYEAYIWALMAKAEDLGLIDIEYERLLERQLTRQELEAAQDEAEIRLGLTEEDCIAELSLYTYIMDKLSKKDDSDAIGAACHPGNTGCVTQDPVFKESKERPAQPSDSREALKTWDVSDIGKLCVHINQKEKNVRVTYGRYKARFGLTELFSKSALRLLIDYDKHAADPHEPAISYHGTSVNAPLNLRRDNQGVVSDFNTAFRKLFGLAKDAKPFTWLPGTKARPGDKTLKIHFQLQVHYRV